MMTAKEIRQSFKDFFEKKGHAIVPSAPMVVKDDPTLMFTNAGMNQWKDIILGTRDPEPRRRADTQKCLRVSGKHNDLEEVGHDTYHHTMFEMLGNWSFGDYFKEGAIDMAWEYLVDVLKLNPDDLYVTVFEGDPSEGLERDNEAAEIWKKHVPEDHIINGNKHDNFWEMGDTGPCGPCSEIHVDSRPEAERKASGISGRDLVNKDDPQVIEIWNLVFMQYNRKADGSLEKLAMNVIDTGMGFERLVRMLQGKHSNYDTDVFQPIIKAEEQITGLSYSRSEERGARSEDNSQQIDVAMRVCADHLRAVAFSIADGQLPGNAKAGYVIRRILRRAVRYAYTFLGQKEAFLYKLLPVLVDEMGDAFPELKAQQTLIGKVIKEEEDSFLRTLDKGIALLDKAMEEMKSSTQHPTPNTPLELSGVEAFRLFDTYGFPLDLTELICRENGFTVNEAEFNAEMQKQKDRARNAAQVENSDWTELMAGEQQFVGYDYTEYTCHILRYRKVTQKKNEHYELVLDNTPFYGEMGGQVGDQGVLVNENETIDVITTKRENNQSVHIVKQLPKDPTAEFMACVDVDARRAIESNHTCTHLLDTALREVLGTHVEQRGSLVTADGLRFDFSHFEKVTPEQLREVEHFVNEKIRQNIPLEEFRDCPIEEAKEMGAIALFGEKYGDRVRVVKFGNSVEFCGGCHAKATGQLGMVRITSESSIAAGIRRIEAITGKEVEAMCDMMQDFMTDLRSLLNNAPDLMATVRKAIAENKELQNQVGEFRSMKAKELKQKLVEKAKEMNGVKVISGILPLDAQSVKDIVFQLRNQFPENLLVAIGCAENDKPTLTVSLSDDIVAGGKSAGQIVREAAKLIQGGGGGQSHFATAGGKNADGLAAAIEKVIELTF
ncbi:MAG: alanine--tRNA ligase [Prevotella sp.]|nr:alanine--tRNA ligase [Prevotella sp.]